MLKIAPTNLEHDFFWKRCWRHQSAGVAAARVVANQLDGHDEAAPRHGRLHRTGRKGNHARAGGLIVQKVVRAGKGGAHPGAERDGRGGRVGRAIVGGVVGEHGELRLGV